MKPAPLAADASTRRALHQAGRAIHRGDLAAAERWMIVCETRLAQIERLAAIATLNLKPIRPHRAADRRPPPPPPPPPAPPLKIIPSPPHEQARIDAYFARKRLDMLAKLFIVPPEHRPPRQRTPPKPRI